MTFRGLSSSIELSSWHIAVINFQRRLRYRQTGRFAKILILLSAALKLWTGGAKQRLRVKEESYKPYIEEDFEYVAERFSKPDIGRIGQRVDGAGVGDLANKRVGE